MLLPRGAQAAGLDAIAAAAVALRRLLRGQVPHWLQLHAHPARHASPVPWAPPPGAVCAAQRARCWVAAAGGSRRKLTPWAAPA